MTDGKEQPVLHHELSVVGRLVGADAALLAGLDEGGAATVLARWDAGGEPAASFPDDALTRAIVAEGEPRRLDSGLGVPVPGAAGRPLGVLYATAARSPLAAAPLELAARVLALALDTDDARAAVAEATAREAAVRRVAELAARGSREQELFDALTREAAAVAGGAPATLVRFDADGGVAVVVGAAGGPLPVDTQIDLGPDDPGVLAVIRRTGRPARAADGEDAADPVVRDAFAPGVPILTGDRVWGVVGVAAGDDVAAVRRLEAFTELVAPVLANADATAELEHVAQDQGALRRVAELVARGVAPEGLFAAVAQEASALLGGEATTLLRFDAGGGATVVATCGGPAPLGARIPISPDDDSTPARVLRTRSPSRTDHYAPATVPEYARRLGIGSSVGAPILVEHRVWGMLGVTTADHPLPAASEQRVLRFAELVAVAIANAQSRAELTASRARVVAAADESRRRVQRDVHDGAQQRLVQSITTLKLAMAAMDDHACPSAGLVQEGLAQAELAAAEMRDLVRGILPATLTRGGLRAGLDTLVDKLPLSVELDVTTGRLPAAVETTAYFIVAEALANVVKHAGASAARVRATVDHGALHVEVRDDGAGGAQLGCGTGLTGLHDRVAAGNGVLTIESPPGSGTRVSARLPLPIPAGTG